MISSVNSYLTNLYTQANTSLSSKLADAEASKKSTAQAVLADEATDTSSSSPSDNRILLSLEDLAGMMQQTAQKQASNLSETNFGNFDISSIDADGDGTVSVDEYDNLIFQSGIEDAASAEDFFAQFDTDEDGEITAAEMEAGKPMKPMGPPHQDEEEDTTSPLDTNEDGVVSAEEYAAAVSQLGITDTDAANELFAAYDTDSSGELSADELAADKSMRPMAPPPETQGSASYLDTDGDGNVSLEEYQAAVSAVDAANSDSVRNASEEFKTAAARILASYETANQYMYKTDGTTVNSTV